MRLLAPLVVLALLAGSAGASHTSAYVSNPVEHDDQGRSDEPDRLATSVLGPRLGNAVLDLDLDGRASPDASLPPPHGPSAVIAPGCTDDSGRRPSGLCGLATVGVAGVKAPLQPCWTTCPPPPGGWTPTRDAAVRFLDVRADAAVGGPPYQRLDVHHKLADVLGPAAPGAFVAGPTFLWAWLGTWQDKNANGVIDHLGDPEGGTPPENEFVWHGRCRSSVGQVAPAPYCEPDKAADADLVAYAWPGHHRGEQGFAVPLCAGACLYGPDAFPGAEASCWATATLLFADCDDRPGDPLLGEQGSVVPDDAFSDRTGEPDIEGRGLFYGLAWPTWYYDQSLLVSQVLVSAYGAPQDRASPNLRRLEEARFLDVDHHRSLAPAVEDLLQGSVKPSARAQFALLREGVAAAQWLAADLERGARVATGPTDDEAWDPGWSHEPNTPRDEFPGAAFGVWPGGDDARHHGWTNDYRAHAAAPHAWADLQTFREVTYSRAIATPWGTCILCVTGPGISTTGNPERALRPGPPGEAGDHARTLGPGIHHVRGHVGRWRDLPQVHEVRRLDLLRPGFDVVATAVGPDGWVGDLLDHAPSATLLQGGHATDTCTIGGVAAAYPWAWCHPYLDGAISDPHQYTPGPEWSPACEGSLHVRVEVEGGVWTFPVLVWRDTYAIRSASQLEDRTGTRGPIVLDVRCGAYALLGIDALVLPAGNVGARVTTTFEATVPVGASSERVVDVDVYEAIGA